MNSLRKKIKNLRNRVDPSRIKSPTCKLKQVNKHFAKFSLRTATEEDVLTAIKKTSAKLSSGLDGFPPSLLKDSMEILCIPLTRLFNLSIQAGNFPQRWKCAAVSPVLKRGNKKYKINYRPVALLSSFSKVLDQ